MTSVMKRILMATAVAESRGHKLARWTHTTKGAQTVCVKCGGSVHVTDKYATDRAMTIMDGSAVGKVLTEECSV